MYATICVPITDLRSDPHNHICIKNGHDRARYSQLISGMCVHIVSTIPGWYEVDVPVQMMGHAEHNIRPYRGWISSKTVTLSFQCKCTQLPCLGTYEHVVEHARTYIGQKYLWGGLSTYNALCHNICTGIDCSGLVYQAFAYIGKNIPRDAKDQFHICTPVHTNELQCGDLVFFSAQNKPISHVGMWTGHTLIEATDSGNGCVRDIDISKISRTQDKQCMYIGRILL